MRNNYKKNRHSNSYNGKKKILRNRSNVNPLRSQFDSNSSQGRLRGNAQQLVDKYILLGKEISFRGNLVLAENMYQYAEHYKRLINEWEKNNASRKTNQLNKKDTSEDKSTDDEKELKIDSDSIGYLNRKIDISDDSDNIESVSDVTEKKSETIEKVKKPKKAHPKKNTKDK